MHSALKALLCTSSLLLLATACGSSASGVDAGTNDGGGSGTDSGGFTVDAAGVTVDAGSGADSGASLGVCPSALPSSGAACPKEGRICEYGDNPKCLSQAQCLQGVWSVAVPRCAGNDVSCPATHELAAGQGCGKMNAYCNYAGLGCNCTNCISGPVEQCGGPLTWKCEAPNTAPGCPAVRANIGSACSSENLFCEYGCEAGVSRRCVGGAWERDSVPNGCPRSTREAKDQVHYLDDAERAKIAEAALALKLTHWHYKEPALASRERLGYILEDAPNAAASDMNKQQVDLYAYTSMVLALAQQQQREIQTLRAEVAALKKRPATTR